MSEAQFNPYFVGSAADPSRAEPVGYDAFKHLCEALHAIVMPKLQDGATTLAAHGFQITKFEVWGTLADLGVRHRRVVIDGWLRFQIHETFAPLLSDEPVFWMYLCGAMTCHGRQGQAGCPI